jgi:hypothetical protein
VGEVPVFTLVVVARRVGWLCPPVVRDNVGVLLPTHKPDNVVGLALVATRHNDPVPAHVEQHISDSR